MEITLENKKYILKELELMQEDFNNCKSEQSKLAIKKRIDAYNNELKKYKKPILIEPPYKDSNTLYELKYVEFTDEELKQKEFVENYLAYLSEMLINIGKSSLPINR